MSTTMTERTETAVALRETDLLDAGIVALESGEYEQCVGQMREGEFFCAEGVLADVLIAAYPERFHWCDVLLWDAVADPFDVNSWAALTPVHWRLLHPRGPLIAAHAASLLNSESLIDANDIREIPFPAIAAALRQAKAEIEAEMLA